MALALTMPLTCNDSLANTKTPKHQNTKTPKHQNTKTPSAGVITMNCKTKEAKSYQLIVDKKKSTIIRISSSNKKYIEGNNNSQEILDQNPELLSYSSSIDFIRDGAKVTIERTLKNFPKYTSRDILNIQPISNSVFWNSEAKSISQEEYEGRSYPPGAWIPILSRSDHCEVFIASNEKEKSSKCNPKTQNWCSYAFPFPETERGFANYLNQEQNNWKDGKRRVFSDLRACSFKGKTKSLDLATASCKYGYVTITDKIYGKRFCELENVGTGYTAPFAVEWNSFGDNEYGTIKYTGVNACRR